MTFFWIDTLKSNVLVFLNWINDRNSKFHCKNFIIKIKTYELFLCYARTIYHTIFELNKTEFEIDWSLKKLKTLYNEIKFFKILILPF